MAALLLATDFMFFLHHHRKAAAANLLQFFFINYTTNGERIFKGFARFKFSNMQYCRLRTQISIVVFGFLLMAAVPGYIFIGKLVAA